MNLLMIYVWFAYKFKIFKKNFKFSHLFLAALDLCCCAWAFSSCGKWVYSLVAVCRLLITVTSLNCGAWALGHTGFRSWGGRTLVHANFSSRGTQPQ